MIPAPPELVRRWESIRALTDPTIEALALFRRLESEAHASRDRDLQALARSFAGLEIPLPLPSLSDLLKSADSLPEWKETDAEPWTTRLTLRRADRAWDRRLIGSGLSRGWRVEALERTLPLLEIGAFHQKLEDELWPEGLVLRVEPANPGPDETIPDGEWRGRWWLLLRLAKPVPLG